MIKIVTSYFSLPPKIEGMPNSKNMSYVLEENNSTVIIYNQKILDEVLDSSKTHKNKLNM